MRTAAVDLGTVRVGLAISDELGLMAHPRPCLAAAPPGALVAALVEFARQEGVGRFVIGLPRQLSGQVGLAARRAQAFATLLQQQSGLEVMLRDEWLTTVEAHRRLAASGVRSRDARSRVDSAAAAVILQSYLDEKPKSP